MKKNLGKTRDVVLISVGLIVAACAAYWQVGGRDFVGYDDNIYIAENKFVQWGLSSESVRWVSTTYHIGKGHPPTLLSLIVETIPLLPLIIASSFVTFGAQRYREVIRTEPGNARAYKNLRVAFYNQGKIKEAVAQYKPAQRLNPDYAEVRGNLKIILAAPGEGKQP